MTVAIIGYGAGNTASVQFALERLGCTPVITADPEVIASAERVILPGVGAAGYAMARLKALGLVEPLRAFERPLLGVCLGHQAMAQAFGASVVRAAKVMHGKTSPITHTGQGVFQGLANPLTVTRYHSLVVAPETLPACFEVTAWSETQEIMGIRHREWDLEGVQFHPESILSEQGHQLLANFLNR